MVIVAGHEAVDAICDQELGTTPSGHDDGYS